MILRKPYVFLAKHFKKIHIVLLLLLIYLAHRTSLVVDFINSYIQNPSIVTSDENLFNTFMILLPLLWILLSGIIISLLVTKKKPYTFYVINILMAVIVLGIYIYVGGLYSDMHSRLLDIRVVYAVRDVVFFVMIGQIVVAIMAGVRATGFDIKKFHFGEDLQGLEMSEADREEFEVNLELDTDKAYRDTRRGFRYAKYIYVENMYLINLIFSVIVIVISYFIITDLTIYHKSFKKSERFTIAGLNMQIQNGYVLTQDYKGNRVTDEGKSLVVVDLNVRKVSNVKKKIDTATAILIVDGHKYYPTEKYKDKTIDLGKTYLLEEITSEATNYLLTYEIPTSSAKKSMKFMYEDKNTFLFEIQTATVKFNPINIESGFKDVDLTVGEEAVLKESVIQDSTLNISSVQIAPVFENHYQFCVKTNECYDSVEYIKPGLVNTYPKTLLKISGAIEIGEKSPIQEVYDLYDLIEMVGNITYKINGEEKRQTLPLKQVIPSKKVEEGVYYVELQKEMEQAEEIELILKIRNVNYHYRLK